MAHDRAERGVDYPPQGDLLQKTLSEPQKKCASHVLRTVRDALDATITLVEDRSELTVSQLARCLSGPLASLANVLATFQSGSGCVLPEEQCALVKDFVGCTGIPEHPESESNKQQS